MLTCVAVVLNVGPFSNTASTDGLGGASHGPAASATDPAVVEQPNGSSFVAQRENAALTPPAYQLSAGEPENASRPIEASVRTSPPLAVEDAAPASQQAAPKRGEAATEAALQRQGPVSAGPATQASASPADPDVARKDTIVGVWAPDAGTCSARDFQDGVLPTVINTEGAWAGDTFCIFTKKQRIETGWEVVAKCSNRREQWTSSVRLTVSENRLTWTSKRGAQAYTRCELDVLMAHAE
jgi:hypothetical protein